MIKEFVVNELKKPVQEEGSSEGAIEDYNPHERQYGHCRKPFGVLRMRVIEFLTEVYKTHFNE